LCTVKPTLRGRSDSFSRHVPTAAAPGVTPE
jgi:hypothetical protein